MISSNLTDSGLDLGRLYIHFEISINVIEFCARVLFNPWFVQCSGMPECKLGLNDRVLLEAQGRTTKGKSIDLEDIKFHQYVCLILFLVFTD